MKDNSIVAEKIPLGLDIAKINSELLPVLEKLNPAIRSAAMGGWAVQGTSGSHLDGWSNEFCPYNGPQNTAPSWKPENDFEKTLQPVQNYVLPTPATTSQIEKLLNHLTELGFHPRKARIIRLSPKSSSLWHQDGSENFYQTRLHIPLVTNPGCFFETKVGKFHMPADGNAYLVHINQQHRVYNDGDLPRLHFVTHAWDTKKTTQYHKYLVAENLGESSHPVKSA
jgi:hypothetical protein